MCGKPEENGNFRLFCSRLGQVAVSRSFWSGKLNLDSLSNFPSYMGQYRRKGLTEMALLIRIQETEYRSPQCPWSGQPKLSLILLLPLSELHMLCMVHEHGHAAVHVAQHGNRKNACYPLSRHILARPWHQRRLVSAARPWGSSESPQWLGVSRLLRVRTSWLWQPGSYSANADHRVVMWDAPSTKRGTTLQI